MYMTYMHMYMHMYMCRDQFLSLNAQEPTFDLVTVYKKILSSILASFLKKFTTQISTQDRTHANKPRNEHTNADTKAHTKAHNSTDPRNSLQRRTRNRTHFVAIVCAFLTGEARDNPEAEQAAHHS